MEQALETLYGGRLSRLPFVVRVPVPSVSVTAVLESMHSWVAATGDREYAASPFRDFSDPWLPSGAFSWHFMSAEAAQKFAAKFSGKIVTKR